MTRILALLASLFVLVPAASAAAAEVHITSGPEGATRMDAPTFEFTASDATECRLDNGPWTPCTDSYKTAVLADGGHLFVVRTTDRAANDIRSFRVDTTVPEVSIDGADDQTVDDIRATVSFGSPEGGVEFSCAIDSDAAVPCTTPWTTPVLTNGQRSIRVIATDEAGNAGVATKLVKIAASPPETVLDGPRGSVRDRELHYGVSADRAGSTFECKVDDGAWAKCDAAFNPPAFAPGAHTVLARATDEAGNVDPTPAGADVEVSNCETKVTIGVLEAVAECFTRNADGNLEADGSVKVNGITFNAIGGHKLVFDTKNKKIALGDVHLKLGSMTLYKGDLGYAVPDGDRVTLAKFDMKSHTRTDVQSKDSESALDLEGDDNANVQGFQLAGEAKLELIKGGKALLSGNVNLPKVFTDAEGNGLSGAVQIESDNEKGVHLSGIQIKAPLVWIGKVEVHNFFVNFVGEKSGEAKGTCNAESPGLRWEGGAEKVVLPTPDKLTVESVGLGFADGEFNYAKGTLQGGSPGLSIGAGIRVQKIAISVCAGPPVTVEGRIALTAADGKLTVPDGGLLFKGGDPWSLRAEAPSAVFKADRDYTFKDVFVQYASSGAIDFGARVNFSLGLKGSVPIGTLDASLAIDAGVKGWIEGGRFNADIDATGCFNGKFTVGDAIPVNIPKDLCPKITGVVSSTGIALCGELKVGDKNVGGVGAGYAWGGALKFMAGTCDVGTWRAVRAGASAASPGARRVTLPGGQRGVLVAVRGIGRAPVVTLRGPGGVTVRTPADVDGMVSTRRAVAFANRGEKTTYVVLATPRGGRWTVEPASGSQIAEVKAASMRPAAKVTASLRGNSLRYRIPRVKGQTVTFEERGRGVAHALGTVRTGGRGTLRFTPADGAGGTRRIVATVLQDGLPRKRMTVATFKAPARAKPGQPGAVKVAVGAGGKTRASASAAGAARGAAATAAAASSRGLTITWKPAKGASRYGVRVVLPDGRKLFFLRGADDRSVRIDDVPADGRAIVRVVGLRADNGTGPAATSNTSLSGGTR
ncbi:hypothetical protein [Solirubrobacter soli]|uniref:hypothetical protein n=1 Tax=Solirubrobacter soli TaxID=363832 RepID=UPI000402C2B3|nr:hypothetical protein [Solirubrobacter soli]